MASNRVGSSSTCFTWGTNSHNTSELKLQIQIHKYNVTTQTHSRNKYLWKKNKYANTQDHIFKHKIKTHKNKDENCNYRILCKYFYARKYKYIIFTKTKLGWTQLHFLCLHSFIKPASEELFRKIEKKISGNLLPYDCSFYYYFYSFFNFYFYFYFFYYLHLLVA